MSNTTYSPLTQPYQTDMEVWLKQLEGNKAAQLTPQLDTEAVGHPTVGVGIDLTVPQNLIDYLRIVGQIGNVQLNKLLNHRYVADNNGTATQNFHTAVANYTMVNGAIPALTADQAEQLYQQVETDHYNNFVTTVSKSTYNIDTTDLLNSDEGLAAFSVAYNSGTPGSHFLADLNQSNFNRADAWVQIRYLNNGGNSQSLGLAKRRYEESEVFGLYDPSDASNGTVTVPVSESKAIYAEFSKPGDDTLTGGESYRDFIFDYENTYGTKGIALANGDLGSNSLLGTDVGEYRVDTLEGELKPAADALNASLNDKIQNPYYNHAPAAFNPLDIQVAETGGHDTLTATTRQDYQLDVDTISYNPSLLIAQGGSDTLDDSKSTKDDALIGGTGDDTFHVGSGNDYIVAGSGNALIEGGAENSAIGSGSDTIVLGEANAPWNGGDDTVYGGSGNDVYYLSMQNRFNHIHLGSGNSTINVVESPTDIGTLALDGVGLMTDPFATAPLAESLYEDHTNHKLVVSTLNPDGTKHLEIFELPPLAANSSSQPNVTRALNVASKTVNSAANFDANIATSDASGELIIDGYNGNNLSDIQLTNSPAEAIEASNLSLLAQSTSGDVTTYYDETLGSDTAVASIYGGDTSGSDTVSQINGQGHATYIYAGNGDNSVFVGNAGNKASAALGTSVDVIVQGGSGNQLLVGVGNSNETIVGGDVGSDTTAWDAIDGGASTGLFEGGSQNSVIYGGTGEDTLIAGSGTATGFNPETLMLAGLSFWGSQWHVDSGQGGQQTLTSAEPQWSIPTSDAAGFQINLSQFQSDGTYAAPVGLLGSTLDPSVNDGSSTLPGSLLIGGTGKDYLIGNQGDDTLVGGTPADPVAGAADEVLVGGAGADLIYGGDGSDLIYADMSPGAASGWADLDPTSADTIYGGSGSAVIYGSGGNDEIYGGSGNYTIYTGNGNDTIDTGSGTAIVYGGSGNDTFVIDGTADEIHTGDGNASVEAEGGQATIALGAGSDTIALDAGNNLITEGSGATTLMTSLDAGSDTIQTGSGGTTVKLVDGLDTSDLVVRDINGDLVLSNAGSDAQITVSGYFANGSGISLQFDDGTTWGAADILQASMMPSGDGSNDTLVGSNGSDNITAGDGDTLIVGTSGNNTLTGGAGNDTIQGGSGTDTIEGGAGTTQVQGGAGTETYLFNVGDGSATIAENTTAAGADTLQFGSGIDPSAVTFAHGMSPNDLLVQFGATTASTITVTNFFAASAGQHQIAAFTFADGTSVSPLQVLQQASAIDGTTGNDNLSGTAGVNYFDGKGGNDDEVGYGGNDTFVFNAGYGHLEIDEGYVNGQQPVLQLGTGIAASALHVSSDGASLYLTDGISGDQILLNSMQATANVGVALVQLADGTTLTAAQLLQMEMAGTTGNDTLYGTTGADLLDGKGGNDSITGHGGNDTFVFDSGYGHLEINETYTAGQQPVLQLGPGITASNLQVTQDPYGSNIVLTDGVSGDQVTLDDALVYSGDGVQSVALADGTTLTATQLVQLARQINGTTGNDTLSGTSVANDFDGKGGNDVEYGDGGNDTFVFNAGYGQLEISENYLNGQQPVLQLGSGIAASVLHVTTDALGRNLYLADGTSGDQVTLDSMLQNSSAGVATVQLADGTTLTRVQLIQLEAAGGSTGNDMLVGTSGAELFDGKGGNDTVNGQGGNDTFVFDAGYGDLTIDEYYSAGQQPVLQLGVGIAASALHVTTNGINLVLTDGVSGDQITLDGMWNGSNYGVASVALADGTTLTQAQLFQMEMTGSSGNDTLYGTTGADRIDGKGGSDSVNGNGGNDTFVFDEGYGQLAISNIYANGEQPVLQLGAGITTATLHASTDGMNVILTDGVNGDQITLDNMWSYSDRGVAAVQLADGTTLTAAQLIPLAIAGQATTGNDTIYGSTGADLFDGKGGSDSILGEGGSDTFVFDAGYGQLYINENYSAGQQPVLQLGSGITAAALHVTSPNGYDLVLSDGISGDQVTLGYMLEGIGSLGVQTVQLADGTTLTAAQLVQMETTGTTGNDTLYGTSGADQFDGKGGTDYAVGHGGNDTFVFKTGYGTLDINENYSSSQQPILQLGAGITAATLHVADSGPNNLVLTDGVSGDQVVLEGMASSSTAGVSEVLFSDGTTLTRAQLLQKQITDAQTITGTSGPDNLTGTADANLIDGKGGNDTVTGNGGSDTFVFDEGYGQLSIYENYTSGQQPVLQLGAGITAASLTVTTDGNETDLTLTDGISGDQIYLPNMLYNKGASGVQQVQFADGTTLTAAQLIQKVVITGTSGNDTLYGMYGGSKIDGKGGKDLEVGDGGGSDTFVFNSGYGKLEINESYGGNAQPVLQLGTGITAAALHVTTNGTNLVLTDGVSGDQVTLDSMWSSTTHGVATVQLSNGSTLTRTQLIAMEIAGGTTGKDTLYGTAGAETLDGKGGGDLVYGAGGNDTFIFNSKYGHLEINNTFSSGQTPVLKLGTGISSTAIKVTHSGNNLILTDGVSGDQITLDGMWSSSTSGVTSVMLADGTTLTRAQLIQKGGGSASSTTPVARSTSTDQMLASAADPANGAEEPVIGGTTAVATPPSTTASSAAINHVIGAGNIVMPGSGAAAPTASATGHGLPVSTSPATSHAASTKAPSAGGDRAESPLATSATPSRDSAPAFSPLPLATTAFTAPGLHVSTPGPVAEPDEGARLTTGAPTDSITHDPNDAAWMSQDSEAGSADAGSAAPRSEGGFDRDATVSRPQARRQLLGRTADAANDMIKALTAQGGLRLSGLESAMEGPASQIQMQDGTVWSLSTLDKALSASATAGRSTRPAAPTAFGSADLAHAQLISAMAAFGPVASASTSLPPTASDADAITLAVRAH